MIGIPLQRDFGDSVTNICEKLLFPSAVKERLQKVDRIACQVSYIVSNPGPLTYPVAEHAAEVSFVRNDEGELELRWAVEIVPLDGWEGIVKPFTQWSVESVARNFQTTPTRVKRRGVYQLPDASRDEFMWHGTPVGFRARWTEVP